MKTAMLFWAGIIVGQLLVGVASASKSMDAWTFGDVRTVIRLLERIEQNTRR